MCEVFLDANDLEVFALLTYLRAHFPEDRLRTRTRDEWLWLQDREKVAPFMERPSGSVLPVSRRPSGGRHT